MGSDETTSERIGRRVREARRRQGIDQAKLALIANVAPVLSNATEVGDLSTRLPAPDPERLRALAAERDAGLAARMRDLDR